MSWTLLGIIVLVHVLAILVLRHRQAELARLRAGLETIQEARRTGSHQARLQYPHIDRSNCIGCATCIAACPEEGVLDLVHGQAMVVHGARCVGCGNCATECPVGAIALTLGDVSDRDDLPVVTDEWESNRVRGLFLGGEVTGYALIRTAIEHGKTIADVVADRQATERAAEETRRVRREAEDERLRREGVVTDRGIWARLGGRSLPGITRDPASEPAPLPAAAASGGAAGPTAALEPPASRVPRADPFPPAEPMRLVSVARALGALPDSQRPPRVRAVDDTLLDETAVSRPPTLGAVATPERIRALGRRFERISRGSPLDDDGDTLVVALAPTPGVPAVTPELIRLDELVHEKTAIFEESPLADVVVPPPPEPPADDGEGPGDGGGDEPGDASGADETTYDLCIVGAGPAGLACSLQAKARGLSFVTLEQERLGGTVARYPRRKLVMTQPVELPLHGLLTQTTYTKEELMELWERVAEEQELPIRTGIRFERVEQGSDGHLVVHTEQGSWRARNVCLALGRRGTPRKLGVPGEDLPKVAYSLLDAESYTGRRILVVGGGDSAVEAALGLASQPGNEVVISYRRPDFFRLKARNLAHLRQAVEAGKLTVVFNSEVTRIEETQVVLSVPGEDGEVVEQVRPNDDVFVMAGGVAPFDVLQRSGVSFDPKERAPEAPLVERGTGLRRALTVTLALTVATLLWALVWGGYYTLDVSQRYLSPRHDLLRPVGPVGLTCALLATGLVLANLAYLARRAPWGRRLPGSLRGWMRTHMVSGVLALLLVLVHGGMAPGDSLGGHAFAALLVLVVSGAIGRYVYAFVPRAANGRELAIDEIRNRLASLSAKWDEAGQDFGERVRAEIEQLVEVGRWRGTFVERLGLLLKGQRDLAVALARLRVDARAAGLPADQVTRLVAMARSAHRSALMAAHYEELRAMLNTWRYLHRWIALLMVLLAGWHIVTSIRYGEVF